ncbi:alpha/beta hydrolase fold [Shewanella halifaxensis HAW-EB4]|uniref:Alpha/beta hydrolase fold n=1 Tax=Shewanella halifaxensis (strain HAW-EB4) TaxID=458817 RepID=B0TJG5_SHEHH|nr:alpha/beta hydrolase [Shewanella halifaxensis]ABZ76961.1 alpha/beta hydrolase fold [Shewanella halifaxensis HAW-EB4]
MATVVLVRGLMRDKRHWIGFERMLKQTVLANHDVISVDTLGNGELASKTSPLNIEVYAEDLCCRLRSVEDKDCYLVGLSMGGMIALEAAARQYGANGNEIALKMADADVKIRGIALINTSAANLSPWFKRFQLRGLLFGFKSRLKGAGINAIEATVVALTSYKQNHNRKLVRNWSRYRVERKTRLVNVLRQFWACSQFICPKKLYAPVVILSGTKDKLVHPDCSQKLAQYYQSKLIEFDQAGHDLSLDSPQKLCEVLIKAFLLEH